MNINHINWDKIQGLLPVIVQDSITLEVLMLGYMNQDALTQTIQEQKITFYSRTKKRLWTKGEESGHFLIVVEMRLDCDNDTLLIYAMPKGNTCHLGTTSCFQNQEELHGRIDLHLLGKLYKTIANKAKEGDSTKSYTASLIASGIKRMAQKVGEEGVEVAIGAVSGDKENIKSESADLLYHLLVLLQGSGISLQEVLKELNNRMQ